MCLTYPHAGVRPSDVLAVALQLPYNSITDTTEEQRFQAQQLTDWFFGMGEPQWLPEELLYEEVEEEVEEYVDEYGNIIEDYDESEYEVYDEEEYEEEYEDEYEEPTDSYGDGYDTYVG